MKVPKTFLTKLSKQRSLVKFQCFSMYINYIRGTGIANGGQVWLIGYGVPSLAESL